MPEGITSYQAEHDIALCRGCGACFDLVGCPGSDEQVCFGCGACTLTCPNNAIHLVPWRRDREVEITVDGRQAKVPERITVAEALRRLGYVDNGTPGTLSLSCGVGACLSCEVVVDGQPRPACVTPVYDGTAISTGLPADHVPRRRVSSFQGHTAGGVGTPWNIKRGTFVPIEVACFTAGCNFRCPQCQNWRVTYDGVSKELTPAEAAEAFTALRKEAEVDRMTFTGGECTVNRPWLVQSIQELRKLNPPEVRIHVDTNGSLLSHDYIDELAAAGMTDVGIDLKSAEIETFTRITGITDAALATSHRDTAWESVRYVRRRYPDTVFLGIGIPYNKELISLEEIEHMAREIYKIDPAVQVCLNDYRPEYRSRITRPTYEEMKAVHQLVKSTGLTTVVTQTQYGFLNPNV